MAGFGIGGMARFLKYNVPCGSGFRTVVASFPLSLTTIYIEQKIYEFENINNSTTTRNDGFFYKCDVELYLTGMNVTQPQISSAKVLLERKLQHYNSNPAFPLNYTTPSNAEMLSGYCFNNNDIGSMLALKTLMESLICPKGRINEWFYFYPNYDYAKFTAMTNASHVPLRDESSVLYYKPTDTNIPYVFNKIEWNGKIENIIENGFVVGQKTTMTLSSNQLQKTLPMFYDFTQTLSTKFGDGVSMNQTMFA